MPRKGLLWKLVPAFLLSKVVINGVPGRELGEEFVALLIMKWPFNVSRSVKESSIRMPP